MGRWGAFILILALAACSPAAPTARLNQDFVLGPGDSARIAETDVTVRFVGVLNDSRCPAGALCIQGGDALVRIEALSSGAPARQYDLHTGDMRPVVHDGLTVALVTVEPYPFISRSIQPDEYRVTLHATR